ARRARHIGFISAVSFTPADSFLNLLPGSYLGFETAFIPDNPAWPADITDGGAQAVTASGDFVQNEFSRGGQRIHIVARPSGQLLKALQTPQRWWALSIGLIVTFWVCSLLLMARQRNRQLTALVDQRTQ